MDVGHATDRYQHGVDVADIVDDDRVDWHRIWQTEVLQAPEIEGR